MNKYQLTQEDLSRAIQFLKNNSIGSDEVSLERLVGWMKHPRHKFNRESLERIPIDVS